MKLGMWNRRIIDIKFDDIDNPNTYIDIVYQGTCIIMGKYYKGRSTQI